MTLNKTALCLFLLLLVNRGWAARLAIVIDDIGYRSDDQKIYDLPKEISVAIIPSAPNATIRAKQAKQQGRDILIHQPMQPKANIKLEKRRATTRNELRSGDGKNRLCTTKSALCDWIE